MYCCVSATVKDNVSDFYMHSNMNILVQLIISTQFKNNFIASDLKNSVNFLITRKHCRLKLS